MNLDTAKTVNIAGHDFEIKRTKKMEEAACIIMDDLRIYINSALKKSAREEALFHEIIEAVNYYLEQGLEHEKITQLSSGIYQALRSLK